MLSGVFVSQYIFAVGNGRTIELGRFLHLVTTAWAFILVLCIYGVYLFIDRRFWEELFHLIDYQKEYDESKTLWAYLAESVVMSSLFVAATHYTKKIALYKKQPHRKETL